jgi:hypothetical protein
LWTVEEKRAGEFEDADLDNQGGEMIVIDEDGKL